MQCKYFISLNPYLHKKISQIIKKSMNEKITKQHSMKGSDTKSNINLELWNKIHIPPAIVVQVFEEKKTHYMIIVYIKGSSNLWPLPHTYPFDVNTGYIYRLD